ncbi:MAG: ribosome maturation factor RimP [Acidobacteriota bacterium]
MKNLAEEDRHGGGMQEALCVLAARAAGAVGLELVHAEYRKAGPRWVVRVYVDREGGVSLDDCARASEQIGALLDNQDLIPQHYTLEVSSPGLDRPLFSKADYVKLVGRRVHLVSHARIDGARHHRGILGGCADGSVTLEKDDGQSLRIPLERIASGRLEIESDHEVMS